MQLEVTATTNLQRATIKDANGARMHNEHDPNVKHSNIQIIPEDTPLNRHVKLLNRNEVLKQQYGSMIEQRNKNTEKRFLEGKIGQEEYQRRMTSIEQYLNHDGKEPKKALTTFVFTLGDIDTEFKILDALGFKYERQKVKDSQGKIHDRARLIDPRERQEFAQIMTDTYTDLARRINANPTGLRITDFWVHMDEGGMPHAQGEMVNLGKTKSGKPSYNLNQALALFCKNTGLNVYTSRSSQQGVQTSSPNGKTALKRFRQIVDTQMARSFNLTLKKHNLDRKLQVTMIRLGKKGGLTMQEYQARKQEKAAHDRLIQANHEAILAQAAQAKIQRRQNLKLFQQQKNTFEKNEGVLKSLRSSIDEKKSQVDELDKKIAKSRQEASQAQKKVLAEQNRLETLEKKIETTLQKMVARVLEALQPHLKAWIDAEWTKRQKQRHPEPPRPEDFMKFDAAKIAKNIVYREADAIEEQQRKRHQEQEEPQLQPLQPHKKQAKPAKKAPEKMDEAKPTAATSENSGEQNLQRLNQRRKQQEKDETYRRRAEKLIYGENNELKHKAPDTSTMRAERRAPAPKKKQKEAEDEFEL